MRRSLILVRLKLSFYLLYEEIMKFECMNFSDIFLISLRIEYISNYDFIENKYF